MKEWFVQFLKRRLTQLVRAFYFELYPFLVQTIFYSMDPHPVYKNISNCVLNNGFTTSPFAVERRVRQETISLLTYLLQNQKFNVLISLFQAQRQSGPLNQESAKTKIKREETGEPRGRGAYNHFFKRPVPVYQLLVYPLIGQI